MSLETILEPYDSSVPQEDNTCTMLVFLTLLLSSQHLEDPGKKDT